MKNMKTTSGIVKMCCGKALFSRSDYHNNVKDARERAERMNRDLMANEPNEYKSVQDWLFESRTETFAVVLKGWVDKDCVGKWECGRGYPTFEGVEVI